jgi:hypothetical protein
MRTISAATATPFSSPGRKIDFFAEWAKFDHSASYAKTYPQRKYETGHRSSSRAERKRHWPKFFATFRQYTCPKR